MRIAIVEDREQDRQELINMLKTYFHNKGLAGPGIVIPQACVFLQHSLPGSMI